MKKIFKNIISFLAPKWLEYGKYLFLVLSAIAVVWISFETTFHYEIVFTAAITSLIVTLRLPFCNYPIKDKMECLIWGVFNYALFTVVASTLIFTTNDFVQTNLGLFAAAFIGVIYYSIIPICSCFFHLSLRDEQIRYIEGNGFIGSILTYIIVGCIFGYMNQCDYEDYRFSKIDYIKVTKWEKELINGNTIYVLDYPQGKLGIYPSRYPEIRDINTETQIKVLTDPTVDHHGFLRIIRLEIKNGNYADKK